MVRLGWAIIPKPKPDSASNADSVAYTPELWYSVQYQDPARLGNMMEC